MIFDLFDLFDLFAMVWNTCLMNPYDLDSEKLAQNALKEQKQ